jgi:hypothetical protein
MRIMIPNLSTRVSYSLLIIIKKLFIEKWRAHLLLLYTIILFVLLSLSLVRRRFFERVTITYILAIMTN